MNNVQKAIELAVQYHSGTYRKNKKSGHDLPYVAHPMEVMKLVFDGGFGTPTNLAAAVLHDVIEDTFINPKIIAEEVGEDVLAIVQELTFAETPGCSKEQKALEKDLYLKSFKDKSLSAMIIKLADRYANVMDFLTGGEQSYAFKYRDKATALFDIVEARIDEVEKAYGKDAAQCLIDAIDQLFELEDLVH